MTKGKLHITAFIAALALGSGCGSEGNKRTLGGFSQFTSGFRVIDSDPYPQTEGVAASSEVRIMFSDSLNTDTIPGNVKIIEMSGGQTKDITSKGELTYRTTKVTNDTVVFIPAPPLNPSARFQITLNTAIRSAANANLIAPTSYLFATGTLDGIGGNISVDGPPRVVAWIPYAYYPCFQAVEVDFNEDLQTLPSLILHSKTGWPHIEIGNFALNVQPNPYMSGMRSFIAYLPGGGCNEAFFGIGTSNEVTLREAIDLSGEISSDKHTFYGESLSF